MQLDLNELRELLAAIDQTGISELTLKSGDFELIVRKGVLPLDRIPSLGESANPAGLSSFAVSSSVAPSGISAASGEFSGRTHETVQSASAVSVATPSAAPPSMDSKWVDVISPMVGTFYRAPAPDELPFVEVGDRIKTGQTVCIIEAMKLMNEIEAEVSGQVMEILVQNAEPVEYGQVLMRINPD